MATKKAPKKRERAVETRKRVRMSPEKRKEMLDAVISKMLKVSGVLSLTREGVAAAAGVSSGLIHRYYTNVAGMRKEAVVMAANAGDIETVQRAIDAGFPKSELPRKVQAQLKAA